MKKYVSSFFLFLFIVSVAFANTKEVENVLRKVIYPQISKYKCVSVSSNLPIPVVNKTMEKFIGKVIKDEAKKHKKKVEICGLEKCSCKVSDTININVYTKNGSNYIKLQKLPSMKTIYEVRY
jgi:hypothetical protein